MTSCCISPLEIFLSKMDSLEHTKFSVTGKEGCSKVDFILNWSCCSVLWSCDPSVICGESKDVGMPELSVPMAFYKEAHSQLDPTLTAS